MTVFYVHKKDHSFTIVRIRNNEGGEILEISRLTYSGECIAYRVYNKDKSEVYDLDASALDTVLREELDKRASKTEELFLYGEMAKTEEEYRLNLDIQEETGKFYKWHAVYEYCGRPVLKGNLLYTVNGIIVTNVGLSLKKERKGYALKKATIDFVFNEKLDFWFLEKHGFLDKEDEPKKFPNIRLTSVDAKAFKRIREEFHLIQIGDYTSVTLRVEGQYVKIDEAVWNAPFYDYDGKQTGETVKEYVENLNNSVIYRISDDYLDTVSDLIDKGAVYNLETL